MLNAKQCSTSCRNAARRRTAKMIARGTLKKQLKMKQLRKEVYTMRVERKRQIQIATLEEMFVNARRIFTHDYLLLLQNHHRNNHLRK